MVTSTPIGKPDKTSIMPGLHAVHKEMAIARKGKSRHFLHDLSKWADDLAELCSLDGIIWYTRVNSNCLKAIIFLTIVAIVIALPVLLIMQLVQYSTNAKVDTSVEWNRADNMTYPNVTVCNAKYFDTRKMEKLNVTNEMANYITMALDTTFQEYYNFMALSFGDQYLKTISDLEVQLDHILDSNNITILELFKRLAIGCEDFVMFCEIHRTFFMSPTIASLPGLDTCCTRLFNPEPIFTLGGTCYTTKQELETNPSTYSYVKLWFDLSEEYNPSFLINIKGSDAIDRKGAYFSISNTDSPAGMLSTDPRKVVAFTSTLVGLSMKETDRSSLTRNTDHCLESVNDTFEAKYGVKQTKLNCEFLSLHHKVPNCSIAVFSGFKELPGLPPCKPKNLLHVNITNSSAVCPYDCYRADYDFTITSSNIEPGVLEQYSNSEVAVAARGGIVLNTTGYVGIQLYYKTFDYPINTLSQESFLDFLSRVGGMMGLFIGGSVFSMIEIVAFLFYFFRILVKNFLGF